MSAPCHGRCGGGHCCSSPATSSWPLAKCHNPNCAPGDLLAHARPPHSSGGEGCCVPQAPQAMSPCQAGYGHSLSNSSRGWRLNPGGTPTAFPRRHRLPCTKPSPAAPRSHGSPGAGRHPAPNPTPGDTAGRGSAGRGTGKTQARSTQDMAGEGESRRGHSGGRKGSGVSVLTQHWSRCGTGTATSTGSWQSPRGAEMCLRTPGASRQLTWLLRPAGWSQGRRRLKLLPEARPSPCHPLISWTSLWDERQGMTPGFDPTSKVRAGHEAPKPGSDPHLWLPKSRERAGMGLGAGP